MFVMSSRIFGLILQDSILDRSATVSDFNSEKLFLLVLGLDQ